MNFKTKRYINLSWGQKLLIVIVLTLMGLVVVTGSAFSGLSSVNDSFNLQDKAADYQRSSLLLANRLLELEAAVAGLSVNGAAAFRTDLKELSLLAESMLGQSVKLDYPQLLKIADRLKDLTAEYNGLRAEWLKNGLLLGFSPTEGKLAELTAAQNEIEKISFSMIKEAVNDLTFTQSKYIVAKDLANEKRIDQIVADLEAVVVDMDWQENVIGTVIAAYRSTFDATKVLISKAGDIDVKLASLTSELKKLVNTQNDYLNKTVMNQVVEAAGITKQRATTIMVTAAASVGIVILISLGTISRQLNRQLQQTQRFLKSASEGDFSRKLSTNDNNKDEFTQLRHASNQMASDISRVISEVVNGSESLLAIRLELEDAVAHLSQASEEVEGKTQQSTVATQQISLAVNDVAKRSAGVCKTSQEASKSTKTGREVISDCVSSMARTVSLIEDTHCEVQKLSQSSKEMLGIVDVINDLADKTNLLALNAAIESARAGEAGRGFSVVADEVRALAQKTVGATSSISKIIQNFNGQSKRIGELMDESITLTSSSQTIANDAMHSIESIESSVQEVVSEMEQVVVAVEEISCNTEDIASQVKHICEQTDQTRTTRATLEEHTHRLTDQAENLGQLSSRFKLSSG